MTNSVIFDLLIAQLGPDKAQSAYDRAVIDPAIAAGDRAIVTRAQLALALNLILLDDLMHRVPMGAAYVADTRAAGRSLVFDHGALRTIRFQQGPTGALPAGELAFRRIFEPLGYSDVKIYPLPALKMTGRAYCHQDFPETIPQFFLSELHVDQFAPEMQAAAERVFGASQDPLDPAARALLDACSRNGGATIEQAAAGLGGLVRAFDRQHPVPQLSDYDILKAHSAEAAWIATEGNAFNHATDRVEHVEAVAEAQRALGRPIKPAIEVSASWRVRQTAFRAAQVERPFLDGGAYVSRVVPGSFFEFISRDIDPATHRIDLAFDSNNATGIFGMTKAAEPAAA